jgi:hypothetical protein
MEDEAFNEIKEFCIGYKYQLIGCLLGVAILVVIIVIAS